MRLALAVDRDLRGGLHQHVRSRGGGDTHAVQPVAAPVGASGLAARPAECFRTPLQAGNQRAGRIGDVLFRILFGLVAAAQFNGIDAHLFRQFVDRALQRDQADRLARRAHRSRQHPVEPDDVVRDPPIVARIEEVRRHTGGFEEILARQVADQGFVADRGELAVGGGAQPHPLFGVRAAHGRVEHLLACHHRLHRAVQTLRRDRRRDAFGGDAELRSEAAADIGRDDPHLVSRHA